MGEQTGVEQVGPVYSVAHVHVSGAEHVAPLRHGEEQMGVEHVESV